MSTPLWHDDDDDKESVKVSEFTVKSQLKRTKDKAGDVIDGEEYSTRLREKYTKSIATAKKPKWATVSEDKVSDGSDSEEDTAIDALFQLTRSTGKVLTKGATLPKTYLTFAKEKDVTIGHGANGRCDVKFHPNRPVLMTCAQNQGTLSFFEICKDATDVTLKKGHNFLQDVTFNDYLIGSCEFYNSGKSVFVGSTKKAFFYTYDLVEGKVSQIRRPRGLPKFNYGKFAISSDGTLIAFIGEGSDVFLFEIKTMTQIHTFAASATVVSIAFAPEDNYTLFGYSQDGAVFIWDLMSTDQQQFFKDEGCVGPRVLSVSKNGQFIACGTDTAIVNVYRRRDVNELTENGVVLKPLYSVSNLTTQITQMRFNHDGQLLAFLSPIKKMSARMVHMGSGTTFQNFPAKQEMLQREWLCSVDFSPHSGYVAFGTVSGNTRLYRLQGFSDY